MGTCETGPALTGCLFFPMDYSSILIDTSHGDMHVAKNPPVAAEYPEGRKTLLDGAGDMSWGSLCRACTQWNTWHGGLWPTLCPTHSDPHPALLSVPSLGAVSEVAAAGVIGTGTHNTGIKHGILPTQVRHELGACGCMVISILRASGEMSHHPFWVWCAQLWGNEGAHCTQQAEEVLTPRDGSAMEDAQVPHAHQDLLICQTEHDPAQNSSVPVLCGLTN